MYLNSHETKLGFSQTLLLWNIERCQTNRKTMSGTQTSQFAKIDGSACTKPPSMRPTSHIVDLCDAFSIIQLSESWYLGRCPYISNSFKTQPKNPSFLGVTGDSHVIKHWEIMENNSGFIGENSFTIMGSTSKALSLWRLSGAKLAPDVVGFDLLSCSHSPWILNLRHFCFCYLECLIEHASVTFHFILEPLSGLN